MMTHYLTHLGVRGTYQGLTATVLKQGTNQAIRFYVMNALRNWYKGEKERPHAAKQNLVHLFVFLVCCPFIDVLSFHCLTHLI